MCRRDCNLPLNMYSVQLVLFTCLLRKFSIILYKQHMHCSNWQLLLSCDGMKRNCN